MICIYRLMDEATYVLVPNMTDVSSAAHEAGVEATILARHGGAPDHPTGLAFPEGEYLKGLVVWRRP